MQPFGRAVRFAAAILALAAGGTSTLLGQGITSAAVTGRVTSESRGTVEHAIVALINTGTGARLQTTTNSTGRFNFENVSPGGPFTVEVRAIGFQQASKAGIMLALGQRYVQDFELKQQVVTLEELTVVAATNPLINAGRTGPAQTVTDTTIQRYPLLGRNFTDLIRTSPQVVSGTGIGGQNSKFNTILIDGGVNNDIFGLSSGGTPGGSAGAKPLSVEALQEFTILSAPFDVRQGSFSGGLINAVTKSGSNQFHGSAFGYLQRPELVGKDTAGIRVGTFSIKQYGGTLGGPVLKNRLFFFGSADLQTSITPFFGPEVTEPATHVTLAQANQIQEIVKSKYGFDPGGATAPQNLNKPDKNIFGKINWLPGGSSQLEVSYNYTRATQDVFNRSARTDPTRDGWQLNNSGYKIGNKTHTVRGKFTTLLRGANLEVLGGYQRVRDARELPNATPLLLTLTDPTSNTYVAAGGERFSHGNSLDQDIYEATANLTFSVGKNHRITVGSHNEFFHFNNVFANNRYGTWTFNSIDSLNNGLASRYEILLAARPGGYISDFSVRQLGGYAQDAWQVSPRLTVTAGVRYDVPFTDKPVENADTNLTKVLGIHTGQFPSGNGLWSPRLGFNWDPRGTGNTIVRGGVGIFSGRPPYVWMSNAFTNTGKEQVTLTCTAPNVPAFTVDVNNPPKTCANSGVTPTPPAAAVNYFDKNFKFQQTLKYAFGIDQRIPGGIVATFDALITQNRNQMYQTDDNVLLGRVNSEGRQLYAAPTATRTPATTGANSVRLVKTTGVLQVVHHTNRNADRSQMYTLQLQKSFSSGVQFSASYTYSKTEDLMTLGSSIATSNLRNTPLDGTLDNRNLRTSAFDVPHFIALNGSANLPFGVQISMVYTARAGTPYAYVYSNDANGDGNITNDLFYVPRDANDITLSTPADFDRLNAFITSEKCLREQRGRIMERGSCRNPWQKFLDMKLAKVVQTFNGESFQVTADIFNVLNLLDKDWGLFRQTSGFEQTNLLTMSTSAYDIAKDRGVYTVPTVMPALRRVQVGSSRWRVQIGGKYTF